MPSRPKLPKTDVGRGSSSRNTELNTAPGAEWKRWIAGMLLLPVKCLYVASATCWHAVSVAGGVACVCARRWHAYEL